jgi:tetratricopeptide (TPR) repeat protein
VAATAAGRPAVGAARLRAALRSVPAGEANLTARILISLAHAEAEQGRTEAGLRLLDEAESTVAEDDRGILTQQRGLLLLRTGHVDESLALLNLAVPMLQRSGHRQVLARTLLNRAVLHLDAGRVGPARADLRGCRQLGEELGLTGLVAKALHNEGCCDLLTGDVPAALTAFDAARAEYLIHGDGFLPVLVVDKARALLTAGLAAEAGRELDEAMTLFRRQRLSHDFADAEMTRARAALDIGDYATARFWADRACRRFRRRGDRTHAAAVSLVRLRADFGLATDPGPATRAGHAESAGQRRTVRADKRLAGRANRLAAHLRELGLPQEAETAALLAVLALVRAGRLAQAAGAPILLSRPTRPATVELRLLRHYTRAELASATHDRSRTLDSVRKGLSTLERHRSRFGSTDLQSSATVLGAGLARVGLEAALDAGKPRLAYAWSERLRAQAFRVRAVRAPTHPQTVEALTELRRMSRTAKQDDRRADLEKSVREQGWLTPGTGETLPIADHLTVAGSLDDRALISYLSDRGRLLAVVIVDGRTLLVPLGDYSVVAEAQRRLLADLDALAGRRMTARLVEAITASSRRDIDLLAAHVLDPLRHLLGDHEAVIVPTRSLAGLPWALLPDLRGRPLCVAPSATVWHSAHRTRVAHPGGGSTKDVLVAGPDLAHARSEVTAIAAHYPDATVLTGAAATVAATLDGLDGAATAHLATHGRHEPANVLFSRLTLADGPLMAYDLDRLSRPPLLAVLSACDVGRVAVRAGDEILGFSAALLYRGTPTVISSVARVRDDVAADVMVAMHRAIGAGASPARALAGALRDSPHASFCCFGDG